VKVNEDGTHIERASMIDPRTSHCAIYANGSIWAIGGQCDDKVLRSCERYNLVLNKWRKIGDMTTARSCATGTAFNQEIYIFGGKTTSNRYMNTIECLNLATLNWKECRVKLPMPAISIIVINRNNHDILLVGGFDGKSECNQMSVFTGGHRRLEVYRCGASIDSLETPVICGTKAYIYNSSGQIREIDISA
jgi:N-acetylneuraminic acid mutarotase